ncbi:restriction endonuclease subunit S [Dyella sp.]|uniref:restriction endonuclease subunit S n=1 Tax=Dyella sp. TaxID=1869338 RepID=UPI002FDB3772
MSLPRYGEYRDIGVTWLGPIPWHWQVQRLKYVCTVFPSNVDKHSRDEESAIRLCNYTDVYYNERITSAMSFLEATASEDQIAKFTLKAGDTIITKDSETADDIAVAAYVPNDLPGVVCGYHLSIVRPRAGIAGSFVKRLFDSVYAKAKFAVAANGLTRVGLGQYALDNIELPFPPFDEQAAIASFLDRETAKIDALIAEQEKLLVLLAEKRQATISYAVTRGLDPNAPMKDSGIPWLGEVPISWSVCAIKRYTVVITDGAHISPETDGGIFDFVSTKDLANDGIDFYGALKTSASSYEYLVRTGCKPQCGDVLFSKDGTIGRTVVVDEERDFVVASSLIIIRPDANLLDSLFLHYLCQSFVVRQQVDSYVKGAGLPRLSIQNLTKVHGVFPTLREQRKIAKFLAAKDDGWLSLRANAETAMTLLRERRRALISAAVTGKIDVSNAA